MFSLFIVAEDFKTIIVCINYILMTDMEGHSYSTIKTKLGLLSQASFIVFKSSTYSILYYHSQSYFTYDFCLTKNRGMIYQTHH
jgi:hypothetical protein